MASPEDQRIRDLSTIPSTEPPSSRADSSTPSSPSPPRPSFSFRPLRCLGGQSWPGLLRLVPLWKRTAFQLKTLRTRNDTRRGLEGTGNDVLWDIMGICSQREAVEDDLPSEATTPVAFEDTVGVAEDAEEERDFSGTESEESLPGALTVSASPQVRDPSGVSGLTVSISSPEFLRSKVNDKIRTQLAWSLPPMSDLEEIFGDLAHRAMGLGLEKLIGKLNGRPLRVGTMCSGTECPLLALEMIATTVKSFRSSRATSRGTLSPPLLFRDMEQMTGNEAQTVFGSWERIPDDLDLVIAGTACVDYSLLNENRKTREEMGESGATIHAMFEFARKYRPRAIILENVLGAPWSDIKNDWENNGYHAAYSKMDSKAYYIPQTRNRVYMVCIEKSWLAQSGVSGEEIISRHQATVEKLKRPASSPASAHLLPEDDRRLEQIERNLSLSLEASSSRAEVSWDRYKERHADERFRCKTGPLRPISRSTAGQASCTPPDNFWQQYFKFNPERIWETLDIRYLAGLADAVDILYKEWYIDLSQGVDRGNQTIASLGIAGCLTPMGQPFSTLRGGPITGLESLSLQGLPISQLTLARESQRELQDLAGNAMTSTTVGAVELSLLSALADAVKQEPETPDHPVEELFALETGYRLERTGIEASHAFTPDAIAKRNPDSDCLAAIMADARRSARYCLCEKQSLNAKSLKVFDNRRPPLEFVTLLKKILPMRLKIHGLRSNVFDRYEYLVDQCVSLDPNEAGSTEKTWSDFLSCVNDAANEEVRFFDIKRRKVWTVIYEGDHSSLHLEISSANVQWLWVREEKIDSLEAKLQIEQEPFPKSQVWERLKVTLDGAPVNEHENDLQGLYEYLPECGTAYGSLYRKEGIGNLPPVYLFLDPGKHTHIQDDFYVFALDHERIPGNEIRLTLAEVEHTWGAQMYPSTNPVGNNVQRAVDLSVPDTPDALSVPDLPDEEEPPAIEKKISERKPTEIYRYFSEQVKAYSRHIVDVPGMWLSAHESNDVSHMVLDDKTVVSLKTDGCQESYIPLISISAMCNTLGLPQECMDWKHVNPQKRSAALSKLSWITQKVGMLPQFEDWRDIAIPVESKKNNCACFACKPLPPKVKWLPTAKTTLRIPWEDPKSAADFEKAVKLKPPPFLLFQRVDHRENAEIKIALNLQAMAHRAAGKLADIPKDSDVRLEWRLLSSTHTTYAREAVSKGFTLLSNKESESLADNPPHWVEDVSLRLQANQRRSLAWMIAQEADDIEPLVEFEVEEAMIPEMAWRSEVRASIPRTIRGGLVADTPGYGKTALALAIIDAQHEKDMVRLTLRDQEELEERVHVRATLLLVPKHIFGQWTEEMKKFLKPGLKILKTDKPDEVYKWTVSSYLKNPQDFTCSPKAPETTPRMMTDWFENAKKDLESSIPLLRDRGLEAWRAAARKKFGKMPENEGEALGLVPSKRLRGKQFAQARLLKSQIESKAVEKKPESETEIKARKEQEVREREKAIEEEVTKIIKKILHLGRNTTIPSRDIAFDNMRVPLQAYHFNRMIVDEYNYLEEERRFALQALSARSKWILSGTPGLTNFSNVNSIARLLGANLGVDDEDRPKKRNKAWTPVEEFNMVQAHHSDAWHESRHCHAQEFLDRFCRQNHPDSERIPVASEVVLCSQLDKEKEVYQRLAKHFVDQQGQMGKITTDRYDGVVDIMNKIIGVCQTEGPVGALVRTSITTEADTSLLSLGSCQKELKNRERQFLTALETKAGPLFKQKYLMSQTRTDASRDNEGWVKLMNVAKMDIGDHILSEVVQRFDKLVIPEAMNDVMVEKYDHQDLHKDIGDEFAERLTPRKRPEFDDIAERIEKRFRKRAHGGPISAIRPPKRTKHTHDEDTSQTTGQSPQAPCSSATAPQDRVLASQGDDDPAERSAKAKEVFEGLKLEIERVLRSNVIGPWRRFQFQRSLVRLLRGYPNALVCTSCRRRKTSVKEMVIVENCGHILCQSCKAVGLSGTQINCRVVGCSGTEHETRTKYGSDLSIKSYEGSAKLDKLIEMVHRIPAKECVLIFVPFADLIPIVEEHLTHSKISCRTTSSKNGSDEFAQQRIISETSETTARAATSTSKKPQAELDDGNGEDALVYGYKIHDDILPAATDKQPQIPPGSDDAQQINKHDGSKKALIKALILPLGGVEASGLNLQIANHCIFLGPLAVDDEAEYEAGMKQAIGRLRRHGQNKDVHAYYVASKHTVDVNILEQRMGEGGVLVERDGQAEFIKADQILPKDERCAGGSLEGIF
ncbi:hypothetical protein N7468_003011 [Penicillium chermesinum]|uniref:Helicase ATP-binding domain-containing protein n=1 Tax=Penicillium chermesinum TaxID=63820 RepID=A0A9W9P8H1_9EURO|nr:uncharacterized protein N7468_003011 [Penicillium chermesinum]KAJ5238392.1 hypothetical protein N7468_003011 [Penicillium chermesinum]